MNGKFRIGILALLGVVVLFGTLGTVFAHDNAASILGLCTMVCVSLLALLNQSTAAKLDEVAKETLEQTSSINRIKKQTDRLTEELVRKSERIAFDAGKDAGITEVTKNNLG